MPFIKSPCSEKQIYHTLAHLNVETEWQFSSLIYFSMGKSVCPISFRTVAKVVWALWRTEVWATSNTWPSFFSAFPPATASETPAKNVKCNETCVTIICPSSELTYDTFVTSEPPKYSYLWIFFFTILVFLLDQKLNLNLKLKVDFTDSIKKSKQKCR